MRILAGRVTAREHAGDDVLLEAGEDRQVHETGGRHHGGVLAFLERKPTHEDQRSRAQHGCNPEPAEQSVVRAIDVAVEHRPHAGRNHEDDRLGHPKDLRPSDLFEDRAGPGRAARGTSGRAASRRKAPRGKGEVTPRRIDRSSIPSTEPASHEATTTAIMPTTAAARSRLGGNSSALLSKRCSSRSMPVMAATRALRRSTTSLTGYACGLTGDRDDQGDDTGCHERHRHDFAPMSAT